MEALTITLLVIVGLILLPLYLHYIASAMTHSVLSCIADYSERYPESFRKIFFLPAYHKKAGELWSVADTTSDIREHVMNDPKN